MNPTTPAEAINNFIYGPTVIVIIIVIGLLATAAYLYRR